MSKKIYLVTGAAGFLGSTVCRQLIDRGENVRAFVLAGDKSAQFLPKEVEIVYGDLCNKDDLERFFTIEDDAEVVVLHIASIVTVNPDYSQKVMDVNVGGTENIVEMCKSHKVSKLVYCSSTGAIPEEERGTIRECEGSIPLDPERIKGCYSMSKAMATNVVLKAATDGLNACVVHPSGILGPEDFAMGETTKTLVDIINGEMPAGIDGSFNLCDVRDLADGVIGAADKGKSGECYILGNEPVSFKDFTKLVSEESGCKPLKFFLPISAANLLAKMLEKKAKKTGEKPLMTTFSVYNLARNNRFDSSKAAKELGYTTRPYRETIRDEIRWLKDTGKIA
ncbi:dihydroflavonol-4-reductase [Pseudobutyrivibrio sp. C4]|uniref:NAD-dependent epimerase/dehydratase family protein n=1 Tax=Pseudobutyrivibrio sp. C4 TaxID=1520803 RepID=UPI0008C10F47|nr:NAD-dependent epimerase/dehydratase family protein [Pseudobutyrivibrio sp. C4]SES79218.1 dihydroflavonol-4-reductase [Pseudobutyrivibrio sp. C4]